MKKKAQLMTLNVNRGSLSIRTNDVHISYEYKKTQGKEVNLFLKAFIGDDEDHYRFELNATYHIYFEREYDNENDKVKTMISMVTDSLMDIVVTIDNILKKEEG